MEVVGAALIGGLITLLISVIGVVTAKKTGLGSAQEKLVASLKELVEAQETRIGMLETSGNEREIQMGQLRKEVRLLRKLTIKQARIITKLIANSPALEKIVDDDVDD